jgi:hypothetical protein
MTNDKFSMTNSQLSCSLEKEVDSSKLSGLPPSIEMHGKKRPFAK